MPNEPGATAEAEAGPMATEPAQESNEAAQVRKIQKKPADPATDEEDDDAPLQPTPAKNSATVKGTPTMGSRASARERKAVERLQVEDARPTMEKFEVKEGSGTKLSDIPNVAFQMGKISGKDDFMSALHRLLYKKPGKGTTRKKAILSFSGFVYDNEEVEFKKDVERMCKWVLADIHRLMDVLDMPRGAGTKDEKAERVIKFLKCPSVLSATDLAQKEADKKEKDKKKRERLAAAKEKKRKQREKEAKKKAAAEKKAQAAKKAQAKKKQKESESEEEDNDDGDEEDDAEEEEEGEDGDGHEEEEPPTKKAKSTPSENHASSPTPAKTETSDSKPSGDGEFWEELCSTDEQRGIAAAAVDIMKTVDLRNFSLKNLMNQLSERLKAEVAEHKPLVKMVAVEYCKEQGNMG